MRYEKKKNTQIHVQSQCPIRGNIVSCCFGSISVLNVFIDFHIRSVQCSTSEDLEIWNSILIMFTMYIITIRIQKYIQREWITIQIQFSTFVYFMNSQNTHDATEFVSSFLILFVWTGLLDAFAFDKNKNYLNISLQSFLF